MQAERTRTPARKSSKVALASLAVGAAGVVAYALAAALFAAELLTLHDAGIAATATPRLILAGWLLNGVGAAIAFAGLFVRRERRLVCVLSLGLNAAPPLAVFGIMAVGWILAFG